MVWAMEKSMPSTPPVNEKASARGNTPETAVPAAQPLSP